MANTAVSKSIIQDIGVPSLAVTICFTTATMIPVFESISMLSDCKIEASENQTGLDILVSLAEELLDLSNVVVCMAELILRKERKQAHYFTEKLGETVGLDMILIPAGTFVMGSPEDELERSEAEGPQHEVTLSSFFMERYLVTQAQWYFVAGLSQVKQELDPDPSRFKGKNHPVENVSWYDAMEFCDRLAKHIGRPYRLPSEAEWEYACRSGATTPFYFGKTLTTDLANYDGNYAYNDGPKGKNRRESTTVDHFDIANAFGLCDMHGNVDEWCHDHWHESYEGAPIDGSSWLSENEDANRVLRGGAWDSNPKYCRAAYRYNNSPGIRYDIIGFRVVCSAPRTP